MTGKLKVMTVLGTRPEIIRLSRVMHLLDQHTEQCPCAYGAEFRLSAE